MTIVPFLSGIEVRNKYTGPWDISSGPGYQVCKKTFGPYIATIFHMYGQEVRYRVKELIVAMNSNQEIVKTYIVRGAGRAPNILCARNHVEETVLPRLLSIYERRKLSNEVKENVG